MTSYKSASSKIAEADNIANKRVLWHVHACVLESYPRPSASPVLCHFSSAFSVTNATLST
jgi:hypothetical protein